MARRQTLSAFMRPLSSPLNVQVRAVHTLFTTAVQNNNCYPCGLAADADVSCRVWSSPAGQRSQFKWLTIWHRFL